MSWEPDSDEIILRRNTEEINRLRELQFIQSASINNAEPVNNMGSTSGLGQFNLGAVGDQIIATVNDWTSGLGEIDVIGAFVKVAEALSGEPTVDCATINILRGGIEGQKVILKPEVGKTICLKNNDSTNASTAGNLMIGADLVIDDTQIVILRYQIDKTYSDSTDVDVKGGWIIESVGGAGGGAGGEVFNWTDNHNAQGFNLLSLGRLESNGANIADIGTIRLTFDESIAWRDVTNTFNARYRYNSLDQFEWEINGAPVLSVGAGTTDFEQNNLTRVADINAFTGDHDIGNTDPFDTIIGRKFQPSHQIYKTGALVGELRANYNDNSLYIDIDDAVGASFDIRENGFGSTGSLIDFSDPWFRFSILSNGAIFQIFDDGINDPKILVGSGLSRGEIAYDIDIDDFSFTHQNASPTSGIIFNTPFTALGVFSDSVQVYEDLFVNTFDVRDVDRLTFVDGENSPISVNDVTIYEDNALSMVLNVADQDLFKFAHGNVTMATIGEDFFNNVTFSVMSDPVDISSSVILNIRNRNATPLSTLIQSKLSFSGTRTGDSSDVEYAFIDARYQNVGVGTHSGSLEIGVHENGVASAQKYIVLNDSNLGKLDILVDTEFNQTDLLDIDNIHADNIRFSNAQGIIVNVPSIGSVSGNSLDLNVPTGASINLMDAGGVNHIFSPTSLTTPNIILNGALNFNSVGADPISNGQMQRNGVDVKVYSGGAVRNLSDIGGGGGGAEGTQPYYLWTTGDTDQLPNNFIYHSNSNNDGVQDIGTLVEDLMMFVPIFIASPVDLFRLGIRVQVSGGVPYQLAFGLYSNRTDGQNYPQTRLGSASGFHSGAGIKTSIVSVNGLQPGLYWMSVVCVTNSSQAIDQYDQGDCHSVGWEEDGTNFNSITGYFTGQTSTSLPNTVSDGMPIILKSFGLTPAIYARFI